MIELETYVDAGDNTGYFARVTRKSDHLSRLATFYLMQMSFDIFMHYLN